jgi:hypothetical protein
VTFHAATDRLADETYSTIVMEIFLALEWLKDEVECRPTGG